LVFVVVAFAFYGYQLGMEQGLFGYKKELLVNIFLISAVSLTSIFSLIVGWRWNSSKYRHETKLHQHTSEVPMDEAAKTIGLYYDLNEDVELEEEMNAMFQKVSADGDSVALSLLSDVADMDKAVKTPNQSLLQQAERSASMIQRLISEENSERFQNPPVEGTRDETNVEDQDSLSFDALLYWNKSPLACVMLKSRRKPRVERGNEKY